RMMTQRDELASQSGELDPAQRQRQFDELTKATEDGLAAILSPAQFERLRQIALQVRGARAFADPEVIESLKLTAFEKQAIHAALARHRTTKRARHGGPEPWRGPADPISHELVQEILALLTPVQKAKWKELTGRPFEGEVFLPPHDPPGPPP